MFKANRLAIVCNYQSVSANSMRKCLSTPNNAEVLFIAEVENFIF